MTVMMLLLAVIVTKQLEMMGIKFIWKLNYWNICFSVTKSIVCLLLINTELIQMNVGFRKKWHFIYLE